MMDWVSERHLLKLFFGVFQPSEVSLILELYKKLAALLFFIMMTFAQSPPKFPELY